MSIDHDRLHDLLERAAPELPELDPGTRAAAVARRGRAARNRSRALVAGAAVAVLAAAVALPLSRGGGADPGVAQDPPTPTAPPCPAAPVDVTAPAPAPAMDDVVAVRSCPATWSGAAPDAAGTPLPAAPLLGAAAAAFADAVTALPAYQMPGECASMSMMSDPWALMVTTAGGETFAIGTTMRACAAVSIGGTDRGAEDVLAAFTG